MDVSLLLDGLNDKQREAVAAQPQHMLVLAGAGSGKTRVLVHRMAWLMQVERVAPYSLLAVTFTNKAAQEMRSRIEQTVGVSLNNLWMGTFHGLSHRLLRAHYQEANLPQGFQIIDSDDQYRLVRRVLKALNLDEKHWAPKQVQWFINGRKDEGERPGTMAHGGDFNLQTLIKIYSAYQEMCDRAGLVDFAEILLRSFELLKNNEQVRSHYQQRFRHILVDEFQDTNAIQYQWLRLLAGNHARVMIVGDDDQSIYGWRGAKVENIQQFLKDFPAPETIRLEQNYRSTGIILKAANAVISNNQGRLGKDLWTDGDDGEPISLYSAFNELDEARFIVSRIREWRRQGGKLVEAAVLYRNNAQSRVLEEALIQDGIHYRIYGGLRFYERQEIKDALSYLRLINNRQDDAALERIINTPTRGIGDSSMDKVREFARTSSQTLWQSLQQMLHQKELSGRAANAVSAFMELINRLDDDIRDLSLDEQADHVIHQSGLYAMYQAEKGEKAQTRIENLNELVNACANLNFSNNEEMSPLSAFLSQAALEAGEYQAEEHSDAVQLMTLHTAKGLEFPLVFVCGLEEGMFPSQQSGDDPTRLEEERRLCYVGMTRAMQKLYLCHAESRRLYGQEQYNKPSRFLREIPAEYVEEIRLTTTVSRPTQFNRFGSAASHSAFENTGFKLGQRVHHEKFGEGTVLNYEGTGNQSRIQINFDQLGSKWLVTSYARLTPSELLQAWALCRAQRWRLPVWAQGDQDFLLGCWQWLQNQLHSTDRIFWLGELWPAQHEQLQVRQIAGQARQQLLGQECDVLVIQAANGMDWDLVAASMGCLAAGGIWLLLTPDTDTFCQQTNPAARRLLSYPTDATQHVGQFQYWLASQWARQPLVSWFANQFVNRLPIPAVEPAVAEFTAPYASHCQQVAVAAIHQVVSGHRHRPLVLSAHRGRGKSAALGIAAAQLQQAGKTRLIITAPQPAAAQVALETCKRELGVQTPSLLQFWPVDRLLTDQPAADLLLIDEAAAMPAPQLQALTERYSRVVFATTEHGYEGTGRGFQLRFQQYLQQHRPGWRKLVLQQPIRYGNQDPLEQLIFSSFLLDGPDAPDLQMEAGGTSALSSHRYNASSLTQQPELLQQVFRLACLAHYQTSVRDLWALLDDPGLLVFTLQQGHRVVAVAIVSQEGQLPKQLLTDIYQGKRRVQGHLAAQSLTYHCLSQDAGSLRIWRVQRLIVSPDLQKLGYGRALLDFINSEAITGEVDLLATSFGATAALARFWQSAGFAAVRLSATVDQSSNEHSVLMVKPTGNLTQVDIVALQQWFGLNLWQHADTVWSQLSPELLQLWARPGPEVWSNYDQQLLQLFMLGQRDWPQTVATLKRWLNLHVQTLTAAEAQLWIALCWQRQDLNFNAADLRHLSLRLRQTACLADLYQNQQS